jgi:hypothetical protein
VTGQISTGEPADQIVRVLWAMRVARMSRCLDQASLVAVEGLTLGRDWQGVSGGNRRAADMAPRLSLSRSVLPGEPACVLYLARARLVFVQHTVQNLPRATSWTTGCPYPISSHHAPYLLFTLGAGLLFHVAVRVISATRRT